MPPSFSHSRSVARTVTCTALALVSFAANSLLCRLALARSSIDAASFSALRLTSGALALLLILAAIRGAPPRPRGTWISAALLFLYAVPFSFAYVRLDAGTGALLLFGSVQTTMIAAALASGERPHPSQWIGLAAALLGLVYLVLPGLRAPSVSGAALMAAAGASWGIYSLRGRGTADPLPETAGNFLRAAPIGIAVCLLSAGRWHVTPWGAALAAASGALSSGVGYVLWYAALPGLSATRAATVQLPVPVLTAAGGVLFLAESVTLRLVVATILVLGGVGLALRGRERLAGRPSGGGIPGRS